MGSSPVAVSVTSCECERSGIVLKRLNTYLWTSMGQNCLIALASMHIILSVDIDAKRVLKIFCKKDRALEFTNICTSKYSINVVVFLIVLISSTQ